MPPKENPIRKNSCSSSHSSKNESKKKHESFSGFTRNEEDSLKVTIVNEDTEENKLEILVQNFSDMVKTSWTNQGKVDCTSSAILLASLIASALSVLPYIPPNLVAGEELNNDMGNLFPKEALQYPLLSGSVSINLLLNTYLTNKVINELILQLKVFRRRLDKKNGLGIAVATTNVVLKNAVEILLTLLSTLPYLVLSSDSPLIPVEYSVPLITALYFLMNSLAVSDMTKKFAEKMALVTRPVRYYVFHDEMREKVDQRKDVNKLLQNTVVTTLKTAEFRYLKLLETNKKNPNFFVSNLTTESVQLFNTIKNFKNQEQEKAEELLYSLLKLAQVKENTKKGEIFNPGEYKNEARYNVFLLTLTGFSIASFTGYNFLVNDVAKDLCLGVFLGETLCSNSTFLMAFTILGLLPINWLIGPYANEYFNGPEIWNAFTQTNKAHSLGELTAPRLYKTIFGTLGLAATFSGGTTFKLTKDYFGTDGLGVTLIVIGWAFNLLFNGLPIPSVTTDITMALYKKYKEFMLYMGWDTNREHLDEIKHQDEVIGFINQIINNIKSTDPDILIKQLSILNMLNPESAETLSLNLFMGGKNPSELIEPIKEMIKNDDYDNYLDTWGDYLQDSENVHSKSAFQEYIKGTPERLKDDVERYSDQRLLSQSKKNSPTMFQQLSKSLSGMFSTSSNDSSDSPVPVNGEVSNVAPYAPYHEMTDDRNSLTTGFRPSNLSETEKPTSYWDSCCSLFGLGSKPSSNNNVSLRNQRRDEVVVPEGYTF